MITKLEPGEYFVFGSNMAGIHGAGAALQARRDFGAVLGVGEGITGQAYAFPTLDQRLRQLPLSEIELSRDLLYQTCREHPEKCFLLTKVGCGLAGYPEPTMRALFTDPPSNLILPEDWQSEPLEYGPCGNCSNCRRGVPMGCDRFDAARLHTDGLAACGRLLVPEL